MKTSHALTLASLALSLTVAGCGGGGGGGGGGGSSVSKSQPQTAQVVTIATVDRDGSWAQVDIIDGGIPVASKKDPADPGLVIPNPQKQALLSQLMTKSTDLSADLFDANLDGIADVPGGFDDYDTGLNASKGSAQRIYAANNVYDLFQTTTGQTLTGVPVLFGDPVVSGASPDPDRVGGPPFNGGDARGDGLNDGGPGLFSNLVGGSLIPKLPVLPNTMGTPVNGSGRGPGVGDDQHQFIQIEFPYKLNRDSLFNFLAAGNSFLGDSNGAQNVFIERRWVTRLLNDGEDINVVDHTFEHAHVPGVAIIGAGNNNPPVCAVPLTQGFATLTTIDLDLSNLPEGVKARITDPKVLTYIAHEDPASITSANPPGDPRGYIQPDGTLILPDPTDLSGLGGRVFGANTAIPSSCNDFGTDGDQDANEVGFLWFKITQLRSGNRLIEDPYFHSFPMDQQNVGADPLAVDGSFNRGPAIEVDAITRLPSIDVLDPARDYLGPFDLTPVDDTVNIVSTAARFRVDFDKEMVPNSVGFSRRHTIHSTANQGILFPFNGNTRPVDSPSSVFSESVFGAPLAPSVFLAVNQPAQFNVNNPYRKNANGTFPSNDTDTGGQIADTTAPGFSFGGVQGLFPTEHNTQATLPRGVVPCDIYPLNQNNLQAYVIEPLVELPQGSIVTIGVCMTGLGMSNNNLPPTTEGSPSVPQAPSNYGNFTRSGTKFTPWQGLTPVGLGDTSVSLKQTLIGNATIIKVNAGPMDLQGFQFFGGTGIALDTLIDGDPDGDNNNTDGGWNVSRTFRVGFDQERAYVNAPVAPQAIVVGFGNQGLGAIDLSGTGFTTNAPGGAQQNTGFENYLVTSRYLPPLVSNSTIGTIDNWDSSGSLAGGANKRAFGVLSRYTSGTCISCQQISYESELAVGRAIGTGPQTPFPGINEGSSGFETMVRDSDGSQFLADPRDVGLVRDMVMGEFLDAVYFDRENPFSITSNHRTYVTPLQTGVQNNTISDPPIPNPPPLRFPVGLPHSDVIFDQADLSDEPVVINGSEVFGTDYLMRYDDGTGLNPFNWPANSFIHLNPTSNQSNPNSFDVPPLPNGGFPAPFAGQFNYLTTFVQTGPMPKSTTAGAVVLSTLNAMAAGTFFPGGLVEPIYQSRQQIGNFLFVTDGVNKKLHAVNSNNMEVIESLDLPDPYGVAITPRADILYVTNEGSDNVSVIDADPRSANFMTELTRVSVGEGPRAIVVTPDNEDVFILNRLGNTMSIIDVGTNTVRRTITQSGLNRPNDVVVGVREFSGGPGFQSGTYHGFISNGGGDNILIYEGGPSGVAGIGFDNVLGAIAPNNPITIGQPLFRDMNSPRGMALDPNSPLDGFAHTIGCFVAHSDAVSGEAMVSRVSYTADSSPGQVTFNANNASPGFGEKVFRVIQQYVSPIAGAGVDVALLDYNREIFEESNFGAHYNLLNVGGTVYSQGGTNIPRNAKYPLASNILPQFVNGPRWDPDRLYLAIEGGFIDVFNVRTGVRLKSIPTDGSPQVLTSYFK